LAVGIASYASYGLALSTAGAKALAIATIVILAAMNIGGVRLGGGMVRWLTILKLGFLGFVLVWGFGSGRGSWSNFLPLFAQRPNSAPLLVALAGGVVGGFFSFGGWWDLSKLAGEVRNPGHTLPRALAYGVAITTLVYVLTSAAFIYLVPLDQVGSGETFAAQAGEKLFGRFGGQVFSAIVIVAVLGSLAAVIMSAPRVYFAMARDGLFIPAAAAVHPRFGTPARAIALQAVLASVLVLLGNFSQIVSYFFFVVVIFLALTVAALFVLRRKDPVSAPYLTPGYPVTPLIFLLLVTVLLFLLGSGNPRQSLLGVGIVALGAPVYYLLFRGRSFTKTADKVVSS